MISNSYSTMSAQEARIITDREIKKALIEQERKDQAEIDRIINYLSNGISEAAKQRNSYLSTEINPNTVKDNVIKAVTSYFENKGYKVDVYTSDLGYHLRSNIGIRW